MGLRYLILISFQGMIFYAMLAKEMLWASAQESDPNYAKYLKKRETGYPPFEIQDLEPKRLLYSLMNPEPSGRPEAVELLEEKWIKSISVCIHQQGLSPSRQNLNDISDVPLTHVHLTTPPAHHH
jgi:hypothetical protein